MNLSRAPSLSGSSRQDSPSLTGWGIAALSGQQETDMQAWEVLRQETEFSSIPEWVPERAVASFKASMADYIMDGVHGFWFEPSPKQDGHSPEQLAATIGIRLNNLCQTCNGAIPASPIEEQLLGALIWINKDWGGFPHACLMSSPADVIEWRGERDEIEFWIMGQGEVAGYRPDFLMWFTYKKLIAGVAIECDGHDFHEKTKEQASRDKKRDREILKAGFPVVRFSGSDIFKSPQDCADQVAELLTDALDRVSRAAGLYA